MVGAFWTDVGNKTFCPEDCSNDVSKAVTLEVLNYEIGDSVKRFGLNVPKRGIFRGGVNICSLFGAGRNRETAFFIRASCFIWQVVIAAPREY